MLKPKVDRLSLTFPVQDVAIRAAIRNHLATLAASGDPSIGKWKKKGGWGSGKYDRSYSLNLSNGCSILIQCAGIKPTVSLLRFEFNPNQIGRSGVTTFRKSIPKLAAGHYQALAEHGQVTRADIAVDLVAKQHEVGRVHRKKRIGELSDGIAPVKEKDLILLAKFVKLCPYGQSNALIRWVLEDWVGLVKRAASMAGFKTFPTHPAPGILLQFAPQVPTLWAEQQAESEPSIPLPVSALCSRLHQHRRSPS